MNQAPVSPTVLRSDVSATHPVPDQHGVNRYDSDPALRELLAAYLPAPLLEHLSPLLKRLGALAGGKLDELAQCAERNPPQLLQRNRQGQDLQRIVKHPAYVEMERLAFGELALAAISHRENLLDWPGALPATVTYALTYLFVQAEFGLCCPANRRAAWCSRQRRPCNARTRATPRPTRWCASSPR